MIERVLVVGSGSIAKRHVRIVRQSLPKVDIRILRRSLEGDLPEGANGAFVDITDGVAFDPQITIIANPASFHVETAIAFGQIGSHLLIEKPLAAELPAKKEIAALTLLNGVSIQLGYNLRFLSSLIEFRSQVLSGAVGRILSVRCETGQYLPDWRPNTDYRKSVSASKNLGGGTLAELSHEIDYLRWVFGDIEWVNGFLAKQSDFEIDVEDTAHLILGFKADAKNKSVIGNLNVDFIRRDATRNCTAIGSEGSLHWNGIANTVEKYSPDDGRVTIFEQSAERDETYARAWEQFMKTIETGEASLPSLDDGFAVVAIMDAARKSAKTDGARVKVLSLNQLGAV